MVRFLPTRLLFLFCLFAGLANRAAAQTPTYFYGGGTGNNVIPFGFAGIADKAQWLYTPAEWNISPIAGNITKVYFKVVTTTPSTTFTNLIIKLSLPGITTLPSGAVPWLPATTVYSATTTFTSVTSGNWISVQLATPFFYPGNVPLLVDVQQGGYTVGLTIPQGTISGSQRRLYGLLVNPNSNGSDGTLAPFGFDMVPACTGTPSVPVITTGTQLQPICSGSTATIVASNPGGPTGMTYQWEQAATAAGPWSSVTGGTGATTLSYTTPTLSTTTFYRLRATCGVPTNFVNSAAYRVAVGPITPGPITGIDTIACPQNTQVYTTDPVFGATSYTWTLPTGWSGTSTTNSITVQPGLANGSITVKANSTCGVSAASSKTVKVIQNPALFANANITYSDPLSFCEGSGVVLTTNLLPLVKYQWYRDNLPIVGADSFSYIAAVSGTYKVFASNNYGCRDTSDTLAVTVHPKPAPVITRNNLTLSTTNSYVTYQWWYNGQTIPGASGPTVLMTGNGIYYVVVKDANGCENRSESFFLGNLAVFNTSVSADAVRIFPNPARNVVQVESPVPVNVFARSIDGRLVAHSFGGKQLDVSALPAGVYTLLITDKEGRTVKTDKLLVQP